MQVFLELVHVIQYEKLGLVQFATKYVRGFLNGGSYDGIPLDGVQRWIGADRF